MAGITPEQFRERYARYFNQRRIDAIRDLNFLFVEGGAEGCWFWDSQGKRYLDFWCMGGTFSLGHRNPRVLAAFDSAMREEDFGSLFFFSEAKGRLAEKLAQCTPGRLESTHPTVTGGEAIDLAIKLARGSTGRTEILYADNSYHGCTGFALSMMAKGLMRDFAEPLIPDFVEIRYGDTDDAARKISQRTAAVVLEPVRTDYDGRVPPDGYFDEVRRLCDVTGAKLIVDEVVCGMGRLGHLWGADYWSVEPDMLVTAKGFSGGLYPMSAVVARPECLDFFADFPFRTISSFAWSNVGARVSLAALEETERTIPRLEALGNRIEAGVATLAARYSSRLTGVRRAGMLFALDFRDDAAGMEFLDRMFELGVLVVASSQRWDIIKLYPPLVLEETELDVYLDRMESALKLLPA
jgi:acetylornithine/succinyldiaminopimelate/putrescine aminotransferase